MANAWFRKLFGGSVALSAFFGLSACTITTRITAAHTDAPVLVGPIRPKPAATVHTRPTHVAAEVVSYERASTSVGAGNVGVGGGGTEREDDAGKADVALLESIGDCHGCWVVLSKLLFETRSIQTLLYSSDLASVRFDGEVIHVLSDEAP